METHILHLNVTNRFSISTICFLTPSHLKPSVTVVLTVASLFCTNTYMYTCVLERRREERADSLLKEIRADVWEWVAQMTGGMLVTQILYKHSLKPDSDALLYVCVNNLRLDNKE